MVSGLGQLRKHVPEFNSPIGVLRFFLPSILVGCLVTAFFTIVVVTQPFWILISEIVLGGLGFLSGYMFFRRKNDFKARYGPLSYSRAASRYAYPGGVMIFTMVARIRRIPGPLILGYGGVNILPVLGWVLIVVGAVLFLRTLHIFGVDNLTMLYVYFPEESRLVNHRIYNIIRNPAYAAAQSIAYGLALLNGSWFAFASALVFGLYLWGWVRRAEEKELIERFGSAYDEYRRRVPAFLPRLRDLGGFLRFLFVGR
jgi:protein-S-isoprenylcysteine O-methyltransferase Ste14/uncharacterized membrane protein